MGDDVVGDGVDLRVDMADPGDELRQGCEPCIAGQNLCQTRHDVGHCCAHLPVLHTHSTLKNTVDFQYHIWKHGWVGQSRVGGQEGRWRADGPLYQAMTGVQGEGKGKGDDVSKALVDCVSQA